MFELDWNAFYGSFILFSLMIFYFYEKKCTNVRVNITEKHQGKTEFKQTEIQRLKEAVFNKKM